jgi:hypothetical protein
MQHTALLAKWFTLTRDTLPSMVTQHRWPIRFDHCFQRVCLDHVFSGPWKQHIAAPAYKTLTQIQLSHAVGIAESIIYNPDSLRKLNTQSISWRK